MKSYLFIPGHISCLRDKAALRPALFAIVLFLFLGIQHAQAQSRTVKLSSKTLSISKLFSEIEHQTGYLFVYSDVDLNVKSTVTFDKETATMDYFLTQFVKGRGIKYEITPNKYVVFSKQAETSAPKSAVKGRVTDSAGEPLIGATVTQKGTQNKTITDMDGNFSIEVPTGAMLVISYIGAKEREVKAARNMDITLADDAEALDEVVVVGYGIMKKKNLTGAVSAINSDVIKESHSTNLSNALQGAAAGLTVTRENGAPESSSTLQIRGVTTISDTSPLIIIDGVPGDISMVNPDDVENISVLKDAASAAIYGSRAAAGVVLITTKRAKSDELSISYNFEYGYEKLHGDDQRTKIQRQSERWTISDVFERLDRKLPVLQRC